MGRQPVAGPPASRTASLGTVVKNSRGVSVTPVDSGPAGASESDRLTRIEQMLEQLAVQQRGMPSAAAARTPPPAAAEAASLETGYSTSVVPAGFTAPPAAPPGAPPDAMTHAERVHQAASARTPHRDWNHAAVPAHGTMVEPARLDHSRAHGTPRRLPPRPSWFEQEHGAGGAPVASRHPLASGQ
jgi:hypothetical protein